MPSVSKAQKKLMAAAAHSPAFAKKVGISQGTAKEWHEEDKKNKDKKLPERKAKEKPKSSNETYVTTASLSGPKGFRDQ